MKDLRPIRGRYYIADLIAQGEHETQDFKFAISDPFKIAHSISAFANNRGGRLLVGVKDNGTIAGVRSEEDIYVVEQAAGMYCDPPQQVEFTSFRVDGGLTVIRAEIAPAAERPVMCRDASGRYRAYYRVADENLEFSPLMLRAWRHKASSGGSMCFDARLTAVVDALAKMPEAPADTAGIARRLHISVADADASVAALFAMDLITFRYSDGAFRLYLTSGEPNKE